LLAIRIGLEGVQATFLASRSAEILDVVAESAGIAGAVLVALVVRHTSARGGLGNAGRVAGPARQDSLTASRRSAEPEEAFRDG
jgi:hypothetical protein